MAIKPKRVYNAALGKMVTIDSPENNIRHGTSMRPKEQVYSDSTGNIDRMSITQQVIEFTDERKFKLKDAETSTYEELLHTIYDAVFMTDTLGYIYECNVRAEHYFSKTRDELCRLNVTDLISGADKELLTIINTNATDKKYTVLEAVCLTGQESRFHSEIVVNQLNNKDHQGLCFFIHDISTRKYTEEELKKANDMLVEAEKTQARVDTISTLLHELNNPLQILTCMAELDENKEYTKQLNRIVDVLSQLAKEGRLDPILDPNGETRYEIEQRPQALIDCDYSRILIVDDEPDLCNLFISSLSKVLPGITIEPANNGREACDLFARDHHGIIIMDMSMPVMNGEEAFMEIQATCMQNSWQPPSFLFITGFDISNKLHEIVDDDPAHCYMKKPVSMNNLIAAIQQRLPQ